MAACSLAAGMSVEDSGARCGVDRRGGTPKLGSLGVGGDEGRVPALLAAPSGISMIKGGSVAARVYSSA